MTDRANTSTRTVAPAELLHELEARLNSPAPTRKSGRRHRGRFGVIGALAGATLLALGLVIPTLAVHDEGFQLEGNVTVADQSFVDIDDVGGGQPDETPGTLVPPFSGPWDWTYLFTNAGANIDRSADGFVSQDFVVDYRVDVNGAGAADDAFDTSDGTTYTVGSKDTLPVDQWTCVGANNVTNKGDIVNAYATILEEAGDRILYFGIEKNEGNGDNNVGLWLLQDPEIGCPTDPAEATAFSGAHLEGDLLLVAEITNGGGVSSIIAYEWLDDLDGNPANGLQSGLDETNPVAAGADCLDVTATSGDEDDICAVTNGKAIDVPWPHAGTIDDENGLGGQYEPVSFVEGGINLAAFDEFEGTCFTGFLFNTRASQEVGAALFDWAMGDIDTCNPELSLDKEPEDQTHNVGDSFDWTIDVINNGDGAADAAVVSDTIPAGLTINGTPTVTGGGTGICQVAGQVVTCTIDVPAGATATITVNVTSTLAVFGESTAGCFDVNNTATVVDDEDTDAGDNSDTVEATICRPTVTKTADGSFTRTRDWTITKEVDPASHVMNAGQSEDSDYTVSVDLTETDSAFGVSGTITVTNPNPEDPMTVDVTDALSSGQTLGAAAITCGVGIDGDDVVVPAGGNIECTYAFSSLAGLDATSTGTNTATATLNSIAFTGSDGYSFSPSFAGEPATINVTDTFDGGSAEAINGPVSADTTFDDYDRTFTCPTDETLYDASGFYTFTKNNQADIVETPDFDTASVEVDCYLPTAVKTADGSFTRGRDWTITKDVDPASHVMNAGQSEDSTYTVSVDLSETDSNFVVAGTITITNPNPEDDMTVDVTDLLSSGEGATAADVDCETDAGNPGPDEDGDDLVVPNGASVECTYAINHTTTPLASDTGTNTATVTLEAGADDPQVTATDTYSFSPSFAGEPATINVTDTFDGGSAEAINGPVSADTTFDDYDRTFTCPTDETLYDASGFYTFTKNNQADIVETPDFDTASVEVDCYLPTAVKTADGSYTETHTWEVTKDVDPAHHDANAGDTESSDYTVIVNETTSDSNFVVAGTITITNPNPEDDMTVDVTDLLSSGEGATAADVDCETDAGNPGPDEDGDDLVVPAGASVVCSYAIDHTTTPLASDTGTNTATVTLEAGADDPQSTATDGYAFAATVVGPTQVDVIDTFDGVEDDIGPATGDDQFDYSRDFTCPTDESLYDENGNYEFKKDNTAEILDGETVLDSDSETVTVDCWLPLPSKTASGDFDRDWDWTIEKEGDQSSLLLSVGQSFFVNYTITVDPTSTDSDFEVSGTITIENPNPEDDMTVDVTDALSSGESIAATAIDCGTAGDGNDAVVPNGDSISCTYEIAHTTNPDDSDTGTNTVTVTLEAGADDPQVTATDPYSFTIDLETDECVDVSDTLGGDLGDVCVGDPAADFSFEYSYDVGQAECGEFDIPNTASFLTNDNADTGSDDWTVHVSIECDQGCTLTQGYWKTHSQFGPAPEDETWLDLPDVDGDGTQEGPEEDFFLSGQTWYEVFWTKPAGNAYYILAKQYMAAVLNGVNGAGTPPAVDTALANAETLFETYTPADIGKLKGNKAPRPLFIAAAGTLASYNEGSIGPGHCDEDQLSSRVA